MKFKISKEEFEKLSDETKKEYEKKGDEYILKVEGMDDAKELKDTLKKVRDQLEAAEKTIKGYKDIDPEKYKELIAKEEKIAADLRDKELELARKNKDIETLEKRFKDDQQKAIADLQTAHKTELDAVNTKLAEYEKTATGTIGSLTKSLEAEMIDKRGQAALTTHKGDAYVLLPHVRDSLRLVKEGDNYVVRVVDPKGTDKEPYRKNDKGEYLTEGDLVTEMKQDKRFMNYFEDEKGHTGTGYHRSADSRNKGDDDVKGVSRIARGLQAEKK